MTPITRIMTDLVGDEPLRVAGLDKVGDVGVPEAVKVELGWEPDGVPVGPEPFVESAGRHAAPPFGEPQRGVGREAEGRRRAVRAEVGDVEHHRLAAAQAPGVDHL